MKEKEKLLIILHRYSSLGNVIEKALRWVECSCNKSVKLREMESLDQNTNQARSSVYQGSL